MKFKPSGEIKRKYNTGTQLHCRHKMFLFLEYSLVPGKSIKYWETGRLTFLFSLHTTPRLLIPNSDVQFQLKKNQYLDRQFSSPRIQCDSYNNQKDVNKRQLAYRGSKTSSLVCKIIEYKKNTCGYFGVPVPIGIPQS